MEIGKKQAIGENLLYLMVWSAIILVPVLNSKMMSELHINLENIFIAWRKIAPYLVIFLVHNAIIAPRYMLHGKFVKYIAIDLLLIFVIFYAVGYYEEHVVESIANYSEAERIVEHRKASFTDLEIYWNVLLGFFMTGANTGIKLIYKSIRDEQELEFLKRQNLQAEMDYLKYQINPHFFMNTLNNIHALIDINAESAQSAVIELSKMMRYVLYDSGREAISLESDVQFIKNYIELMRIRYTGAIDIKVMHTEPIPQNVFIPPLLLIVFIENAFKHGISYNRPSFIHVDIEYSNGMVTSTICNSCHTVTQQDKDSSGIGLENVKKRLELIYGNKGYTLKFIEDSPMTYTIKLSISALNA